MRKLHCLQKNAADGYRKVIEFIRKHADQPANDFDAVAIESTVT